jgi:hypothetical protein
VEVVITKKESPQYVLNLGDIVSIGLNTYLVSEILPKSGKNISKYQLLNLKSGNSRWSSADTLEELTLSVPEDNSTVYKSSEYQLELKRKE